MGKINAVIPLIVILLVVAVYKASWNPVFASLLLGVWAEIGELKEEMVKK